MSLTQIGAFKIGDKPKGMPKPVKFILDKFSNGREEDKLAGYISFLKDWPQATEIQSRPKSPRLAELADYLRLLECWRFRQRRVDVLDAGRKYLGLRVGEIPPPVETPNMGLLHPDSEGYFESPRQYLEWYRQHLGLSGFRAPTRGGRNLAVSQACCHQAALHSLN
jgi:magnesium chelatase subunit H